MKEFYINCGSYKMLEYGTLINDELIYTKSFNQFTIYHIQTGMTVVSGKRLMPLIEKALQKMNDNKEHVQQMINEITLTSLPVKNDLYSIDRKIVTTLKVSDVPIDEFILAVKGLCTIDFIKLDRIMMKSKKYNHSKTLNENIIDMYGKDFLSLLNNYKYDFFEIMVS